MKNHSKKIKIIRHREGQSKSTDDFVAIEEPLEIRIENKSIAIVMRTPGHDQELTAGFLLSEGAIKSSKDIFEISECINQSTNNNETGNYVDVILTDSSNFNFEQLTRHVFTSSSCGVCGKATVESVMMEFDKINSPEKVNPSDIFKLPEKLLSSQETFKKTGGLHASALFDENGEIVVMREDVGRHNALDKVIGYALLNEMLPLKKYTLLLSGRISFELMQKSLAAGIPTVAGISAPSSLAIDFAKKSGQNLIGFLRDQTMNIYS